MPRSRIPSTISSRPPHHHSRGPPVYGEWRLLDCGWALRSKGQCWRRGWFAAGLWGALDDSRRPRHGEVITNGRMVGIAAHLANVKGGRTGGDSSRRLLHTTGKEVQALSQNMQHGQKRVLRSLNKINELNNRTSTERDSCKYTIKAAAEQHCIFVEHTS